MTSDGGEGRSIQGITHECRQETVRFGISLALFSWDHDWFHDTPDFVYIFFCSM